MVDWSADYKHFKLRNTCPKCKSFNLLLTMYYPDGRRLPVIFPVWNLTADMYGVCSSCNERIYVGKEAAAAATELAVTLRETHRTEEHIGEDERTIDNRSSRVSVRRTFSVSKEWTRSYEIEHIATHTNKSGGSAGISETVKIEASVEESIQQKFSISGGERRVHSEEVTIEVPAHTCVRVTFSWKRIWQHGEATVASGRSPTNLALPFRVALGLTFDQRQFDE